MDEAGPQQLEDDREETPPPLTGTTVRGIRVARIGYAVTTALTFATFVVLARLVTPAAFGATRPARSLPESAACSPNQA